MPLERPAVITSTGIEAPKTHSAPGGRWSTRWSGKEPKLLGTGGGYLYGRERKTGYLTKAPSEPSARYIREKDVQYMDEYGEHESTLHALTHPWDMLLRYGGAKEFPLAQILEHVWQRFPPVIDGETVVFPQLEGQEYEDIDCPFCFRPLPSEEGKRNHVTVMHADRVAADDLATGVTKGMTAAMNQNRQVEELVSPSIESAEPIEQGPEIWRCTHENCDRFFDTEGGRNAHVYTHKKEPAVAG